MGVMRRSISSKASVPERLPVQKFQEIKPSCSHLIDLRKNGSIGNATGVPTKT